MNKDDNDSLLWWALLVLVLVGSAIADRAVTAWKEVELKKIEVQNPQPPTPRGNPMTDQDKCTECDAPISGDGVFFDVNRLPFCRECYQELADNPDAYPEELSQ